MTYFKQRRRLNLDVTHRCPLECPNCQRQTSFTNYGLVPHGRDLTMKEIKMIAKHFVDIGFCGQLSDPVHHPRFNEIMKELKDVPEVFVHNAATAKPMSWYVKSFKANPKAVWIFACDGLPDDEPGAFRNQPCNFASDLHAYFSVPWSCYCLWRFSDGTKHTFLERISTRAGRRRSTTSETSVQRKR